MPFSDRLVGVENVGLQTSLHLALLIEIKRRAKLTAESTTHAIARVSEESWTSPVALWAISAAYVVGER